MEELYLRLSEASVPQATVVCSMISAILAVAIPAFLALYIFKKYNCSLKPLLAGALTWLVFARIIEGLAHQIILRGDVGATIQSNLVLYALYGGVMAALFEEFGRLIVMKTALKKEFDYDRNALMFGAGHGGIEAIVILGLAMLSNLTYAQQINNHTIGSVYELLKTMPEEQGVAVLQSLLSLTNTESGLFLLGIVERIPALALHLAMSALVWKAVKDGKYVYFVLSLAVHFLTDFTTVIISGTVANIYLAEALIVAVCTVLSVIIFFFLKNKEKEESIQ